MSRVAIIGLGLIGGSVARALKHARPDASVSAYDRNPLALQYALERGFIARAAQSPSEAVEEAQTVILATPPSTLRGVMEAVAPALAPGALVMDTASVKEAAVDAIAPLMPEGARFIPAHPIAGSEQSGVAAGKADLFAGRQVMLTPSSPDQPGLKDAAAFWQSLGATVEYMPPSLHDTVYGYVSHLPQWLAHALKDCFSPYTGVREKNTVFRRFTRLCQSDTVLWEDIFAANRRNLDQALARYLLVLDQIRTELRAVPEGEAQEQTDNSMIYSESIPQILASCLVASVYQEERACGFGFSRYAGQGFADFTAPAQEEPEAKIAFISRHAAQVAAALDDICAKLAEHIVIKD